MLRKKQPLLLRIQDPGPNPQKVAILLEELSLPFTLEFIEPDETATTTTTAGGGAPPVQDKNTGMIILTDPNTNITLWESLAVVEYLTKTYDHENILSYGTQSPECWHVQQWLAYQMGAQSPFFSLKAWFSNKHVDKVPSVIARFADDVTRIVGIVEHYLILNGTGYLVGNKCTYADLVFVPWNKKLEEVMGTEEATKIMAGAPNFRKWQASLIARPAVQRVMKNPDLNS